MSGLNLGSSPTGQTSDSNSVPGTCQKFSKSVEDSERRDLARKRKKWKQNLLVSLSDEEDKSSDSDVQNNTTSIFENNEAIALRFPYPMDTDDSDNDDENLNYYPRVSKNINCVNNNIQTDLCSDENIEISKENKSYKHKKRKSKNAREVQPLKCKNSVLKTDKEQRSKQTSSKKNASQDLVSKEFKTTSQHKSASSKSLPQVKSNRENNEPNTDYKSRKASGTTKRTSINIRNKNQSNKANSRFLDSSSEDEVVKPVRVFNKFRKLHVMSTSSSSSDEAKNHRSHILLSSSSDNDKGQESENKVNEDRTLKPSPVISQNNLGSRRSTAVHLISSSSGSESETENHSFSSKNKLRNKVPIEKTPIFNSNTEQSSKSLVLQYNKQPGKNKNCEESGKVDENKVQTTKDLDKVQCKPHINTDVWKNIANAQIKRPKSSTHQSYLQTLKKQFMSSNTPSVEVHKKIIDKTFTKKDNIKPSKESCSKLTNIEKDFTPEERPNSLLNYSQRCSIGTPLLDNIKVTPNALDFSINMNVNIICSPDLVENMNNVDSGVSQLSGKNNNEATHSELDISLSLNRQENKKPGKRKAHSFCPSTPLKRMKLPCPAGRISAINSKSNDSNKLVNKTQSQKMLQKFNKTIQNISMEDMLKKEKKTVNTESEERIQENNEVGNDILSNILSEMDKNPFKAQMLLPKKVSEPSAEMLGLGSLSHNLQSTPQLLHCSVNLQSPEKENEFMQHPRQEGNELYFSIPTIESVRPEISLSDSCTSINTIGFENLVEVFPVSNENKNPFLQKTKDSEEKTKKTTEKLSSSFYSVNSDDYIQPHENQNDENEESNRNSILNTSNLINNTLKLQILDTNRKTSPCKEIIKENQSINNGGLLSVSGTTDVHKLLSPSVRNALSTNHDPSTCEQSKNCLGTRDRLQNRNSSERNIKDKEHVQYIIDELAKIMKKDKPSIAEKGLNCDKIKNTSSPKNSNNSNLENTALVFPQKSTTPLEKGTINDYIMSNKEIIKSPDNENNIVAESKPSKGIRIRYGGNVYRLPGKENVIDSNAKMKKQRESILSTVNESKNKNSTNISINNSVNNSSFNSPCTVNTEDKSDSSSSSSEDSSDDSSSSEDNLGVSGKKSSENSSSESTSEDEKEEPPVVESMNASKEIPAEVEIKNKDDNKELKKEKVHLSITSSKFSGPIEPPKFNFKSFSLDELLGFQNMNKTKTSLSLRNSNNIVSDNAIILSSSNEPESNDVTNNSKTVLDQSREIASTETSDDAGKGQSLTENKVWKIRVKSFEELGISNAFPMPENALKPSRPVAVESKEQSSQALQPLPKNVDDVLNPICSDKNDFAVHKTSGVQPLLEKEGTNVQSVEAELCRVLSLQKELSEVINEDKDKQVNIRSNKSGKVNRSSSVRSTNLPVPKISIISKNNKGKSKINIISKNKNNKVKSLSKVPGPSNTFETPTVAMPVFLKKGVMSLVTVPTVNKSTKKTRTLATSSSCSTGELQNRNQPSSKSIDLCSLQTLNTAESTNPTTSQQNMECLFFKLCDELFNEVVMMKIPKMVDDLHLVIAHDIMREERLKKVDQLKCPETKEEEKRRTEKEFMETLKIRGQGFVPLFMTIVRKMDKGSMKALVVAFYCKIIQLLEQIDPVNRNYRFKLTLLIKKMLLKNNVNQEICDIFCDNASFVSNFNFIENLLLKYDQFVIQRNKTVIQRTPNTNYEVGTEKIRSQTGNSEKRDISETRPSDNQVRNTTTVHASDAESSTSVQTSSPIRESNIKSQQVQLSGRLNVNQIPIGNLDRLLFGSFCQKVTNQKP